MEGNRSFAMGVGGLVFGWALLVGYLRVTNKTFNVAAVGQVAAVHGNYGVGALLNGAVAGLADVSQQAQYSNLIPLGEEANANYVF